MRLVSIFVSILLVTSLVPPAAVGVADDDPLADAGLDQEVSQGSTVYLDGGGSYAPDSEIVAYEWSILAPSGEPIEPNEPAAVTTSFEATELGTYEVTLQVTDDEGRTSEDALYVDVEPGADPSVALEGPETATPGEALTYTAALTAGDAPLETVIWRVDGETVGRSDADSGTVTHEQVFETLGEKDVSITVVDSAGNRDASTLSVDVSEPDEAGGGSGWYAGLAVRDDPVVVGPQYVDGEKPLDAAYRISSDYAASIDSVTWRVDGETAESGDDFSIAWSPGHHTLSALVEYDDGSKRVVTFEDGEREVLANPKPFVKIDDVSGFDGTISGSARASDEVGLQQISVEVGGDRVETWVDPTGEELHHALEFAHEVAADSDTQEVRVGATDSHGQTAYASEVVDVVEKPTIVSAEFLNDPVDSYHERIDEERYTVEFEMVVDIGDVDPGSVEVNIELEDDSDARKLSEVYKSSDNSGENLIYTVELAAETPGYYDLKYGIEMHEQNKKAIINTSKDGFRVQESDPEVRLDIQVIEGRNIHTRRIVLDASNSFDPDGSALAFTWKPNKVNPAIGRDTAETNINGLINMVAVDAEENTAQIQRPAMDFYSPELIDSTLQRDTYEPDETIQIDSTFEMHDASDESFQHSDLQLEVVDATGEVVSWTKKPGSDAEQTFRRTAVVEIPAAEFLGGGETPKIKVYNEENPEQTKRIYELPEPNFDSLDEPFKRNVEISETRYLVEEPVYDKVSVDHRKQARLFRSSGYEVFQTTSDAEFHIERLHVQEAEYETREESFDSQYARNQFLKMTSGWESAGSKTTTQFYTTTNTDWRSYKGGSGEFTGQTRRVQTQSPMYRTEYRYSSVYGGSYWSTNAYHPRDYKTGDARRVQTRSAQYETQYQFETERTRTTTETTYFAEKQVQTQPRVEEWRDFTTTSETYANELSQADDLRIGNIETDKTWQLRKETGRSREEVATVEEEQQVVETYGVIEGEMAEYYVDEERVEAGTRKTGVFEEKISVGGYAEQSELIEKFYELYSKLYRCEREGAYECSD